MKKKKFKLDAIEVKSFITTDQKAELKGGVCTCGSGCSVHTQCQGTVVNISTANFSAALPDCDVAGNPAPTVIC